VIYIYDVLLIWQASNKCWFEFVNGLAMCSLCKKWEELWSHCIIVCGYDSALFIACLSQVNYLVAAIVANSWWCKKGYLQPLLLLYIIVSPQIMIKDMQPLACSTSQHSHRCELFWKTNYISASFKVCISYLFVKLESWMTTLEIKFQKYILVWWFMTAEWKV